MPHQAALVWGGPITYNFGPQHPLQPVRVELAVELMRAYGLLDRPNVQLIPPRLAGDDELQLIHSPDYIDAVRQAGALNPSEITCASVPKYCLGPGDNPIFPEMHEASAQVAGGSIDAAEFVMRGPDHHAFSTLPWPADTADVIVTEKDAVKLDPRRIGATRVWVAPLDFDIDADFEVALLALLPPIHRTDHGHPIA